MEQILLKGQTIVQKKNSDEFKEVFMAQYKNLVSLGIPIKTSRQAKKSFEDIITILSTQVCHVGDRQVENYIAGKCMPSAFRWGKTYQELLQQRKFTNCPPELKRRILTTSGCALYPDQQFSLENCQDCKICPDVEFCRSNTTLYPHCPLARYYFKFTDDDVNLSLNLYASIKNIHSSKVDLPDYFVEAVDAIYHLLNRSKGKGYPKIHREYIDVLFKNVSLLTKATGHLWKFTLVDEDALENALACYRHRKSEKEIGQIEDNKEMAVTLLKFAKELEEIPRDSDMMEMHSIAEMDSFNKLKFLEACFVTSNLPVLMYNKLRPVDVQLYALLMQYFSEEDMEIVFQEAIQKKQINKSLAIFTS